MLLLDSLLNHPNFSYEQASLDTEGVQGKSIQVTYRQLLRVILLVSLNCDSRETVVLYYRQTLYLLVSWLLYLRTLEVSPTLVGENSFGLLFEGNYVRCPIVDLSRVAS